MGHPDLEKDVGLTVESKSVFQASVFPQICTTLLVCMASFSCGTSLVWTSSALPDLDKSKYFGPMTSSQKSWIGSSVTLGALCCCPFAGFLVDYFGRRKSLLLVAIPNILGWTLIAFSPNIILMCLGRVLSGVAVGGFILVVNVYLAEISEQRIRGMLLSTTSITLGFGMLYTYIMGTFFSWFVLTVVNLCFSVALLFGLRTIPESPVFLIHKGSKKKAGKVLMRLRGATEFHQIQNELNEMQSNAETGQSQRQGMQSLWEKLTRRGTLKALGICYGMTIFQQMCGVNAVMFNTLEIFSAAKTTLDPNMCTIIIGFDILFAVFLTSYLIDKLGRRILLFISLLGLSICLSSLGMFFYLQSRNNGITPNGIAWVPLTSLMFFIIFYNVGIGPLAWFLMSELIPTDVKGPACAIASFFNWFLAFVVTFNFQYFQHLVGIHGCFWYFSGVCVIGIIFSFLFVPETKGKSLEEIQRQYFKNDEVGNVKS